MGKGNASENGNLCICIPQLQQNSYFSTEAFYSVISEQENVAMDTFSTVKYFLAVIFCVKLFFIKHALKMIMNVLFIGKCMKK